MKPRQPPRRACALRERWQFQQAHIHMPGRCGGASPHTARLSYRTPGGRNKDSHMPADALKCKECKTQYPLEARYVCERCFGPLEVAYSAPERRRGRAQAPHPGGSAQPLALRGLPPARARSRRAALHTGFTPLVRADRLAERLGLRRGLGQERDRQPDALLQGPRRLRRARPRGGARLRDDRLRLDGQPRQRRRRPRRRGRPALLRLHPLQPRGGEDPRDGRLRDQRGRRARQLRRRQPPLHRAVGRARRAGRS